MEREMEMEMEMEMERGGEERASERKGRNEQRGGCGGTNVGSLHAASIFEGAVCGAPRPFRRHARNWHRFVLKANGQ